MTTIQIKPGTKVGVDEVIKGVAALDTHELEQFFQQVAQVLAGRKAPHLSAHESDLLLKISNGYPATLTQQYEQLIRKKETSSLSADEHQTLIELADQFELLDATRMQSLIELALLRNISLEDLLKQLSQPSSSK